MQRKRIIIARKIVPSFSTASSGNISSTNVTGLMILDVKEKGVVGSTPVDINEFMEMNKAELITVAPYNLFGMNVAVFSIPAPAKGRKVVKIQ